VAASENHFFPADTQNLTKEENQKLGAASRFLMVESLDQKEAEFNPLSFSFCFRTFLMPFIEESL